MEAIKITASGALTTHFALVHLYAEHGIVVEGVMTMFRVEPINSFEP